MPPRHVTLAIVAFWVAMSGWLFYHELWPRLRPGEPPPYLIDLVEEARTQEQTIFWEVLQNGKETGYARTGVSYQEADDTFLLHGEFKLRAPGAVGAPIMVIESSYRVTRGGDLRAVTAHAKGEATFHGLGFSVTADVTGEVRDGRLYPHFKIQYPLGTYEDTVQPVAVSERGSVLNPLQPVNRLQGLRAGQHWRLPLIDPLASVLPGSRPDVRVLEADVSKGTLDWYGREVPCFVIDYRGDDARARTWAREADGMVLQQEVSLGGESLILRRGQ
jgi:hypothetical protein